MTSFNFKAKSSKKSSMPEDFLLNTHFEEVEYSKQNNNNTPSLTIKQSNKTEKKVSLTTTKTISIKINS